MIEAKTHLVGVTPWVHCHLTAGQKILVQRNAENKGRGSKKGSAPELGKRKTCTAGYQPATEPLCLGRNMGVGNGAPEKVTSEQKYLF